MNVDPASDSVLAPLMKTIANWTLKQYDRVQITKRLFKGHVGVVMNICSQYVEAKVNKLDYAGLLQIPLLSVCHTFKIGD